MPQAIYLKEEREKRTLPVLVPFFKKKLKEGINLAIHVMGNIWQAFDTTKPLVVYSFSPSQSQQPQGRSGIIWLWAIPRLNRPKPRRTILLKVKHRTNPQVDYISPNLQSIEIWLISQPLGLRPILLQPTSRLLKCMT